MSFSPLSNAQLCVSGDGVLKTFRYADGCLRQSGASRGGAFNVLSHAWGGADRLAAGTDTGRLLVFEGGDLRREMVAGEGR